MEWVKADKSDMIQILHNQALFLEDAMEQVKVARELVEKSENGEWEFNAAPCPTGFTLWNNHKAIKFDVSLATSWDKF